MNETGDFIRRFCSQVWWLVLLRGLAVLVLGIFLIAKPGMTLLLLIQFLGIYFLVDGIFVAVNSVMGRKYLEGWGWGLLMGSVEILTGLILVSRPILGAWAAGALFVYVVATLAIVFGLLGIFGGLKIRKEVKGEWAMITGGVLAVVFGLILLLNPKEAVVAYLIVMGVFAVIGGAFKILVAFQLRKIGKEGFGPVIDAAPQDPS